MKTECECCGTRYNSWINWSTVVFEDGSERELCRNCSELEYYKSQIGMYSDKENDKMNEIYSSLLKSDIISKEQKEAISYFYMRLYILENN